MVDLQKLNIILQQSHLQVHPMKKFFFYLISLTLFSTVNLPGTISETDKIESIFGDEVDRETLVLLNLTNTIYTSSNTMGNSLWKNYFSRKVRKLFKDEKVATGVINRVKNKIVKAVQKRLIEEKTSQIISDLQNKQIPVLGLTLKHISRPYANNFGKITARHLLSIGVDFKKTNKYLNIDSSLNDENFQYIYGLIFSQGKSPGKAVESFLNQIDYPINKVIVIDNSADNLKDLEEVLGDTGIAFHGFHYIRNDQEQQSFDPILGNIQFLTFLETNKVISDEEANMIKQTISAKNIHAMLNEAIISLAQSERSIQTIETEEQFNPLYHTLEDYLKKLASSPKKEGVTRLFFVRHGESESNFENTIAGRALDIDLTTKGVEQCEEIGELLGNCFNETISYIYSSPLKRALQTSEVIESNLTAITQRASIPLKIDDRLLERYYGRLEGASPSECILYKEKETAEISLLNSFEERFSYKFYSEMESLKDIYHRVAPFIQEVSKAHRGENLLISTHNGVMKALFIADAAFRKGYEVTYRSFDLKNASVLVIESYGDRFVLKAVHRLKFRTKQPN